MEQHKVIHLINFKIALNQFPNIVRTSLFIHLKFYQLLWSCKNLHNCYLFHFIRIQYTLNFETICLNIYFIFIFPDDENAIVHGVLTNDNLFDGTITTNVDDYYIEPSHKYSQGLREKGVHSIVYKSSDVKFLQHLQRPTLSTANNDHYCASERLRKKMKNDYKRRRKDGGRSNDSDFNSDNSFNENSEQLKRRRKRFLPDEVSDVYD